MDRARENVDATSRGRAWPYSHADILAALVEAYPDIQTRRFNRALATVYPPSVEAPIFRRVPDAFAIYLPAMDVDLFEIEITSGLTPAALADYAALMVDLSFDYVTGRLFVVSRFGHINEIDTRPWYNPCKP